MINGYDLMSEQSVSIRKHVLLFQWAFSSQRQEQINVEFYRSRVFYGLPDDYFQKTPSSDLGLKNKNIKCMMKQVKSHVI